MKKAECEGDVECIGCGKEFWSADAVSDAVVLCPGCLLPAYRHGPEAEAVLRVALVPIAMGKVSGLGRAEKPGTWAHEAQTLVDKMEKDPG